LQPSGFSRGSRGVASGIQEGTIQWGRRARGSRRIAPKPPAGRSWARGASSGGRRLPPLGRTTGSLGEEARRGEAAVAVPRIGRPSGPIGRDDADSGEIVTLKGR